MITGRTVMQIQYKSFVNHYNINISVRKALGLTTSKDMSSCSFWDYKKAFSLIGYGTTEYALKHPNVQQFLHTKSHHQHYDLVLVEEFYQDALLMLSHQFQAPIVSICKSTHFNIANYINSFFGSNQWLEQFLRYDFRFVRRLGACSA